MWFGGIRIVIYIYIYICATFLCWSCDYYMLVGKWRRYKILCLKFFYKWCVLLLFSFCFSGGGYFIKKIYLIKSRWKSYLYSFSNHLGINFFFHWTTICVSCKHVIYKLEIFFQIASFKFSSRNRPQKRKWLNNIFLFWKFSNLFFIFINLKLYPQNSTL